MKALPTLYKRSATGAILQWTMYISDFTYYAEYGQVGGLLQRSAVIIAEPKNIGRANATTAEEQAQFEAESAWKKKMAQENYVMNIEDIDNVAFLSPMLAYAYNHKFDSAKHKFIQPKLDGIRCNMHYDTSTRQIVAISRHNKPFFSVDHIKAVLLPILSIYPGLHIDGELYNHALHDDFNKIVSIVKKQKLTITDKEIAKRFIRYNIYDLWDENQPNMPFNERYTLAYNLFYNEPYIDLVDTSGVASARDIDDKFKEYTARGYEGAIIRSNEAYQHKRCNNLLKYKEFHEAEFEVLGIYQGRSGTKAEFAEIQLSNGKTCKATLAFTDEECEAIMDKAFDYIGCKASVQFFGYTPDGKLRFPVLKAFRDYE